MRLQRAISGGLIGQRGHLFGWAPVFFAIGIAVYFGLRVEPGPAVFGCFAGGGLIALLFARVLPEGWRPICFATALVAAGFCIAGARTHLVAKPVLSFRYYGPIEGRIVEIDRSASDAVRLTLDRVVLEDLSPGRTPAHVRVSLHGEQGFITPEPGQVVILTGHLSPPSGPVEPGGFDFRRMAWFEGLGAVGYTRTPVLLGRPAEAGTAGLWIYRQRVAISRAVQDRLPGEVGAFAAAIMTGDRSGIGAETLADVRASNLAHLLAISGLHMGLLTGFVFAVIRYGLALLPGAALRWPVKKVAAAGALPVAAAYLALSGGNVATERAFIMVAVMLVAVLLDRRALTLRAVAIAALIVLLLRPEALSGPGFQMSFAATTALVAVFGALRQVDLPRMPRWLRPVGAVTLSSLVAGLATAPFAAAHFNQIAHYGLLANVLSVPLMGMLVMPAAVLAALLAPLGLATVGLWLMGLGIRWILGVAHWVSAQQGALSHVPSPGWEVLALLSLGGLLVVLWQGRMRWAGLAPAALAFILWAQVERPALLIADSGALIGVLGPEGRSLSKERGDGFAATAWLENDGAPVDQARAFGRPGLELQGRQVGAEIAGVRVLNVRGRTGLAALVDCNGAGILVLNQRDAEPRSCEVFDIDRLRREGAVAGYVDGGKLRLVTVRDVTGDRLWNAPDTRDRRLARQ